MLELEIKGMLAQYLFQIHGFNGKCISVCGFFQVKVVCMSMRGENRTMSLCFFKIQLSLIQINKYEVQIQIQINMRYWCDFT